MKLSDLIANLDSVDQGQSIYVEGPPPAAGGDTLCRVVFEAEDGSVLPDPGSLSYLLEVGLAQEAILVAAQWRGRPLSAEERVQAVLHYAVYDAYLPPEG